MILSALNAESRANMIVAVCKQYRMIINIRKTYVNHYG